LQLLFQPVVAGDERALGRLSRATDQFSGEELCKGRRKLSGRIRLPIGRQEKSWIILFALISAEEPLPVVQQQMPFTLPRKLGLLGLIDELFEIQLTIGMVCI